MNDTTIDKDAIIADMLHTIIPQSRTMKTIEDEIMSHNFTRHRLDDLRARILGLLEGDLSRHLKTIQTCLEMEPPRIAVAKERIETIQALVARDLNRIKAL